MGYMIDIDTGGTFTDGFIVIDGDWRAVKVPTTPHDLTVCFLECIAAGARVFGKNVPDFLAATDIIRFSNTIGTNTIIQRNGARIGLLVSPGDEVFAPTAGGEGKSPLVAPDMVLAVDEATDADGRVVRAPDAIELLNAAQTLIDRGARCLVIAFANSDVNPENERFARACIKKEYPREYLGSLPTFLASDISPRTGRGERVNAAVLNAYIHSKLSRLLYKAGEELRERGYRGALLIGHNNGAVARVAKTRAINTYNSGPAAGLYGAREVGRLYGLDALISTDMGGTSFDIGYVRAGQCSYALRPQVEGFACNLPMMAIEALGAGGGSIARVEGGELKVGPQSAGAAPGPACFGLGGDKATVTDANLVLGILDADYFLGGGMKLNVEKAREAIRRDVAEPLGVGVEEAAWRIKREVERAMGRAVGGVVGRLGAGKDVPVVAYGGAGAIHAADIADEAGLNRVIITPFSAVSSAFGSSLMDVGHIYHRRIEPPPRKGAALDVAMPLVEDMRAEARRDMRGEGFAVEQAKETLQLLWADESGREAITDAPMAALSDVKAGAEAWTDGRAALGAGAYLIGVSYAASASVPHFRWSETPPAKTKQPSPRRGVRQVYLGSDAGAAAVPVFDRGDFERDHKVAGPAIVESEQTTILVPNGWRFSVDKFNNANLERA